jgi:hypothetical protein
MLGRVQAVAVYESIARNSCLLYLGPGTTSPVAPLVPSTLAHVTMMVRAAQNKKDCPLTFASDLFVEQTGFPLEDIIGKNCRFLQGAPGISDDIVRDMSKFLKSCVGKTSQELEAYEASQGAEPRFFLIVNARKDGSEFLNLVHM